MKTTLSAPWNTELVSDDAKIGDTFTFTATATVTELRDTIDTDHKQVRQCTLDLTDISLGTSDSR